jgi:hypothetical protein
MTQPDPKPTLTDFLKAEQVITETLASEDPVVIKQEFYFVAEHKWPAHWEKDPDMERVQIVDETGKTVHGYYVTKDFFTVRERTNNAD